MKEANAKIEVQRNQLEQASFEVEKQQTMLQQAFIEIESSRSRLQQAEAEIETLKLKLSHAAAESEKLARSNQDNHNQNQNQAMQSRLAEAEKLLSLANQQISELKTQLDECRNTVTQLEQDNKRLLSEYYDMKHEALVASLCEKDANVALMQLAGPPNAQVQRQVQQIQAERAKLQEQMMEVAQVKAQIQAQLRDSRAHR